MSFVQSSFVTISCDGPECDKTATFAANDEANQQAQRDNPWLLSHRAVQTPDRRNLSYCSDECEAKAVATGAHNKLEKRIIPGANAQSVDLAAQAAEHARKATEALKQGSGKITLG